MPAPQASKGGAQQMFSSLQRAKSTTDQYFEDMRTGRVHATPGGVYYQELPNALQVWLRDHACDILRGPIQSSNLQ
eukprot:1730211-Alexandrium_andersonii.AAC.1